MNVASETETLLATLAKEASSTAEAADETLVSEAALANGEATAAEAAADQPAEPAVLQVQEQVDDGEQVTTTETTYVADANNVAAETVTAATGTAPVVGEQSDPASLAAPAEAQTTAIADQPTEPSASGISNAETNGVAEADGTTAPTPAADAVPAEPERGRSKKRRARWGPPANAPAEPAANAAGEGEQTGRKKRRSRWEEPAPAAEDSQQLTVIDTAGGAGFPHEIVLAGGIKVPDEQHASYLTTCAPCAVLHASSA